MARFKRIAILICLSALLSVTLGTQIVSAEEQRTYVVQPGDTLIDIAVRYGLGVDELAAANAMSRDGWIFVGQRLTVPGAKMDQPVGSPEPVDRSAWIVETPVSDPLPSLPVLPEAQLSNAAQTTYARVTEDNAPVYAHPSEAAQGLPPKRTLGVGFVWVSVDSQVTYEGRDYYQINPGEYVAAEALSLYAPSTFQGVALAEQPEHPFAWILQPVQPLLTPGGDVNPDAPVYQRYDMVQIYATERLSDQVDQVWYLIGADQWISQIYVGKVTPSAPPEGMVPGAAWVEVDLFEQTLAAYVGDRMVYATLVSSGLPGWDTPPGLFQVWLRVTSGKMSGGYNRPDYYFLEDVRWTMYFNKDVALHTAYWHDGFGYKRSHGCVNLAPSDAKWLFEWASSDLWVWVH